MRMPLLNEKPMVNNKRYSLTYQFKQFDWDKGISFDDPLYDYESVLFSLPAAIRLANELHLAILGMTLDGKEHYRWDDNLFFNHTAINLIGATMYFLKKNISCNVTIAHVAAVLCHRDPNLICQMLSTDRETEIFVRQYRDTRELGVDGHFMGIKGSIETILGTIYNKEFFYLCTEGQYKPLLLTSEYLEAYNAVIDWAEDIYERYCPPKSSTTLNDAI